MQYSPVNPAPDISHIVHDDQGRAWIDGSNVKVIEVVLDHLAYGWSPEEIHWQQPHLSLGQVYAALAYYHDHRDAFDAMVKQGLESADVASKASGHSPAALRLRAISAR